MVDLFNPEKTETAETTETTETETTETVETEATDTVETEATEQDTTTEQETEQQQTDDATEESVERVVPAADGYTLPEGVPPAIGEFAHANDMTQAQLDATLSTFSNVLADSKNADMESLKQQGAAHVAAWGPDAAENMSLAKRALAQSDPKGELAAVLRETGFYHHPAVLNYLYDLGKNMREGGFLKSETITTPGKRTMAQKMFGNHPSETD